MPIHLYVEHLLNIRSLSIQASLSTDSNEETQAEVSADHRKLTLTHEGQSATVQLPINIPGRGKITLTLPAVPTKELSFRLSVEERPESQGLFGGPHRSEANIVPWTATSLSEHTEICCKACGSVIVTRGSVSVWKNLPSEGWAEMMEFWHCHKPEEPHDHAQDCGNSSKGYAAQSRLSIEPTVGLVGALDFTFASSDCKNIEISHQNVEGAEARPLECSSCKAILGTYEPTLPSFKIRKPCLTVSNCNFHAPESYSVEEWLACRLLTGVEEQGVPKFTIIRASGQGMLKLWIFTPDLTISSSAAASFEPLRAIKVLWRYETSDLQSTNKLNRQNLFETEIEMPTYEQECLEEALEQSAHLLPENLRTFQNWNIGLLPRIPWKEQR